MIAGMFSPQSVRDVQLDRSANDSVLHLGAPLVPRIARNQGPLV